MTEDPQTLQYMIDGSIVPEPGSVLLAIVGLAILFQPWRPYWRQRKTLSAIVVTISAAALYIMLGLYEQTNSANGFHWRLREILILFSVIVAWWDALRKKPN